MAYVDDIDFDEFLDECSKKECKNEKPVKIKKDGKILIVCSYCGKINPNDTNSEPFG